MSDGLSDAAQLERQHKALIAAAAKLADAIKEAQDGHRGLALADFCSNVNLQLRSVSMVLVPRCPECGKPLCDPHGAVICRHHKYT